MRAALKRVSSSDQGTFGVLEFGANRVYTIELPWRDNQRARSCIPPASYECQMVRSPRFGLVYGVVKVPGRSNVLIHSANFAGDVDKGYTTQLEGCIAPAMRLGQMRNNAGQMQSAGLLSRPALNKLMEWSAGKPFQLEISNVA